MKSSYSGKPHSVNPIADHPNIPLAAFDVPPFVPATPEEGAQRVQVCKTALTYLNTPYEDHGKIRGAGVDCASLLICVYGPLGAGIIPEIDPGFYPMHSAFLRRGGDADYLRWVRKFAREIKESEVLPGDLVMFKVGRGFSHGAIVIEWPRYIIHATKTVRGVIASHGTREGIFTTRERRFFSHWGKK